MDQRPFNMVIKDTLLPILQLTKQTAIDKGKFLISFTILMLFITLESFPKNFYFSSSTGNDSYTAIQAQNPNTPWKSIDQLNKSMNLINPGDSILFKRGDTFTGQIILTRSGTASDRIVFSAYGKGNLPVIKGTLPLTGWTRYSGNIWQAYCPQLGSTVTNFFINGKSQQIGRYPNADAPNKGYFNIDSHTGGSQLVSSSLLSSPNWTGGEAVVRTRRWILDRVSIKTHQGNTLNFTNSTSYEIYNNYGFFIQNHLNTLDQIGEWYFDASNKKMYLFYSTDPNSMKTEATAFSSIFEASNKEYFLIENIELIGSIRNTINISNSNNVELKNNIILESGNDAVNLIACKNINFTNNKIIQTNNNALVTLACRNIIVTNNYIHRTGLRSGMVPNSTLQFTGLLLEGNNINCESNNIDSVGYIGINFQGDSIFIKNNYIANFCITKDDGGGLYTSSDGKVVNYNRVLEKNIVLNGIGAGNGTDNPSCGSAQGIYLDDRSNHVTILDNTVANCAGYGIFIHNSNNLSLIGNTVYNNSHQLGFVHDNIAPDFPITNCLVENNIFFSKSISQLVAEFRTIKNDISQFGTFNNNYYCRPISDDKTIRVLYTNSSGIISELIDLRTWQKKYNYDLNSSISPFKIPTYSLLSFVDPNKFTNGTFDSYITGWSSWSNYNNSNVSWDNSDKLDNGCLKMSFSEPSGKTNGYLILTGNFGEVIKGEKYVLRFSMVSSNPEKKVRIAMRRGSSPFSNIAYEQYIFVSTNRKEYELLFMPGSSETSARIDFEIEEDGETYWIDNLELYKANIKITNTEDSILFLYNPGNTVLTINDGNYYIDSKGIKYPGSITLLPYTSAVLLVDPDPSAPPVTPVYISSAVENATPARLEITYNLSLANIVPVVSAFEVRVNSTVRTLNSVTIAGTKVLLTLASPVAYGDVVTVAYTKPSTNPLQTSAGGQPASISAQTVTNRVAAAPIPIYVSSAIENATPARLEMTYNLTLANIVPAASAFAVKVNSVDRTVSSVAISGTKVLLTLASPVVNGDVVTVAYTKPSTNPLQTTAGGQAATISAQTVSNKVNPASPVFVSSAIENATPARLEMTYNLTLANIVPAGSAFTVQVNSVARNINTVAISGTKVLLTLASPVVNGDVVTVSYTKPSTNPLQAPSGGQAASLSAQSVSNKVNAIIPLTPVAPVYVSSSIGNATPARVDMNYSLSLANILPAVSAFSVRVNSVARTVNAVSVSGTVVMLTLASPVVYGDVVTAAYTRPATNPLQTAAGGQAATISAQTVTNNVSIINTPPVVVVNSAPTNLSGFVAEIDATGSYDLNNDNLTYTWVVPNNVPVSSTSGSKIQFLSPIVNAPQTVEFTLIISDGKTTQSKVIPVEILPYKPELEVAKILKVEASSYQYPNFPFNILDGNIGTMWAADGNDKWLLLYLKEPFKVDHVKLAFQSGMRSESYFDILGSKDNVTWEPILTKSTSCGFSGNLQVFSFPAAKSEIEYSFIKLVGHSNSVNTWNYISEFKLFGFGTKSLTFKEKSQIIIYPNPAHEFVNILIKELSPEPDFIRIINLSGKVVFQDKVIPDVKEFQILINILKGVYIFQMGSGDLTLFTQKLVIGK